MAKTPSKTPAKTPAKAPAKTAAKAPAKAAAPLVTSPKVLAIAGAGLKTGELSKKQIQEISGSVLRHSEEVKKNSKG